MGGPMATGAITIQTDQIDLGTTSVQSSGALTITPHTSDTTIGLGGGIGTLNLNDAELADFVDGFSSITIGEVVAGTGDVDIDTATFLDPVTIAGGTINDNVGTDIIAQSVTLQGNVSPGQSPGILTVSGDFTFADGDKFTVEIGGTLPGTTNNDHDQLDVGSGTVTIGNNVTLNSSAIGGFTPATGDAFVIINNDGTDAVMGEFAGLPEGSTVTIGGVERLITYQGGMGNNDVVLRSLNQAPVVDLNGTALGSDFLTTFTEDGPAVYISDIGATISDPEDAELANLTLVVSANPDGADETITVAGEVFPLNADSTATGTVGSTTFEVNYSAATRAFSVTKDGGGTSPIGDLQLLLRGITFENASDNPTTTARTIDVTANDGTVDSDVVTVTIDVVESDDASVISGSFTGDVVEGNVGDSAVTASGSISISDVDQNDSPTIADVASTVGDNAFGSFELVSGTWTYTLDQNAVQDLVAGEIVDDTITFTATDGNSQEITVTITGSNDYSLAISSAITDVGGDGALGSVDAAGEVISYQITVFNDGDQPLNGVVVSDPLLQGANGTLSAAVETGGTSISGDGILEVGETFTYTASYTGQQSDIDDNGGGDGDIDNTTSVVSMEVTTSQTVGNEVPIVQNPSYVLTKMVTDVGGDGALGSVDAAGDVISYEITVFNDGNQSINGVVLSDPLLQGANGSLNAAVESGAGLQVGDAIFNSATDGFGPVSVGSQAFGSGLTFYATFTPTAGDVAVGQAAVVLFEIGAGANGSGLYLRDGQIHFISKMNGAQPNIVSSFNDLDVDSGNNMIGAISSFGTLTAGTEYSVAVVLDPVNETLQLAVLPQGGSLSIDSFDLSGTSARTTWSGDGSVTAFTISTAIGGSTNTTTGAWNAGNIAGNPFEGVPGVAQYWNDVADISAVVSGTGAGDGILDVGETFTYTGSYTAQQSDIDNNGGGDGDIDNTASVVSTEITIPQTDSVEVPIDAPNVPPTLTSFASVVDTTNEDTEVELTFGELASQGDEADVDGTVIGFVVQSVSSGTLTIGADASTATWFVAGVNDTIDASNNAYWTGAQDDNGILNAFTVLARDNEGEVSGGAVTATINVNEVNEAPTALELSAAAVDENMANGTVVGTLSATDPDTGETFTFTEVSDLDGKFAVVGDELRVDGAIDFEDQASHDVTLRVTDSGGVVFDKLFTIGVNDVNEAPTVNPGTFHVDENSPNTTSVGTVMVDDPDAGDSIAFTITGGNTGGAFDINNATGEVTVINHAALDFETTPTFNLTVQAEDAGGLVGSALVTINLNDIDPGSVFGGVNDAIEDLKDTGLLNNGEANPILNFLGQAIKDYNKGKFSHAVQKFEQARERIQELIDDGDLDSGFGQPLISQIDDVITEILAM